ncbi:MAG: replication-associated recombination protein A [Candidatus Kapaibacteriales bacterium]
MRPKSLSEVVGHDSVVGQKGIITELVNKTTDNSPFPSLIFWGEPGTGKTSIADILSKELSADFIKLESVTSGVKDLRSAIERGQRAFSLGKRTILFVDEIHRFNKAQQDILLMGVEKGYVTLVGATTENPSFEINRALLSRCRVVRLEKLSKSSIATIFKNAIQNDDLISQYPCECSEDQLTILAEYAGGDARSGLNILEFALRLGYDRSKESIILSDEIITKAIEGRYKPYDKSSDYHYDNISAFIKSMRGSDPDAALIYMQNMLQNGEDPKFIARRMIIFASEEIGLADSFALTITNSAFEAVDKVGLPEGNYALSHACIYLSLAPKSNSIKNAMKSSAEIADKSEVKVPYHLRNGVTNLMKDNGMGKGYKYPHDYENNWVEENYLPEDIAPETVLYNPQDNEKENALRNFWSQIKKKKQ